MVGRMLAGDESDFLQSRQTREVTTATWRVGVAGHCSEATLSWPMSEAGGVGGRLCDDEPPGRRDVMVV